MNSVVVWPLLFKWGLWWEMLRDISYHKATPQSEGKHGIHLHIHILDWTTKNANQCPTKSVMCLNKAETDSSLNLLHKYYSDKNYFSTEGVSQDGCFTVLSRKGKFIICILSRISSCTEYLPTGSKCQEAIQWLLKNKNTKVRMKTSHTAYHTNKEI